MRLSDFTIQELTDYIAEHGSDENRKAHKEGKNVILSCEVCGERMPYRPQGRARKFCSDRCKQSAYRRRKNASTD